MWVYVRACVWVVVKMVGLVRVGTIWMREQALMVAWAHEVHNYDWSPIDPYSFFSKFL